MKRVKPIPEQFQTPSEVCLYMVSLLPTGVQTVLEPTPGQGNLVKSLKEQGYKVHAPKYFFQLREKRYDAVVMNPPFSCRYAFGLPASFTENGMRLGYYMLMECMKRSDRIIALMPWFTLTDSDLRVKCLTGFGLKSITHLPRKTFEYCRIQTMVLELRKGYAGPALYKTFNY